MFVILALCGGAYLAVGRSIESYGIHLESDYDYVYDGGKKEPKVTLKGLTEGKQYIVSYSKNTDIGVAKVTVSGIGRFRGKKTKEFNIIPDTCENFTPSKVTDTTVKLTWNKAKHGHRCWLYIYNENTLKWDRIKVIPNTKTGYTVKNLKPDTNYRFRLKTVFEKNGNIYTGKSAEILVKTQKPEGKKN